MVGVSVQTRRAAFTSARIQLLYLALAFFLTVFAIAPLGFPGFFQSHTGYSAVYNLIDLHTQGARVIAWAPTWGRAYDFMRMDGPLGYWLAEIFHLVGFSFLDAIKIIYALAFLLSAFGMFKLAQRVLKNDAAALLASVLYVYTPAHIATVYVRGAFGEAIAWGLFPIALISLISISSERWERIEIREMMRRALPSIIAFAALVLAQAGLAILFAVFAAVWLFALEGRRGKFFGISVAAMFLGLALGFILQLPALLPQNSFSAANGFVPAFVYPFQLLSASWGTDVPRGNFMEDAPYQIGFAALGLTIVSIALVLRRGAQDSTRRVMWFSLAASFVLLGLMMPFAEFLWNAGLNLFLQYPFQLLALVSFVLTFAAASLVITDSRFQDIPLLAALVIVPVLAVYPYLAPEFIEFSPTRPALARFNNNELALLDAKIVRPPGVWRHGATVELDLTWQALKQPNRDYTVSLKILDEPGNEWGATDEKPQGGALSTLNWIPSRVYSDTHSVQIDLNGPNEGYHLELGIYQTTTGERAVTETGADAIVIDENRQ